MIKCYCINDKNKPEEIPDSHWVKYGQEYTVISIYPLVQPGAIMGVVLKEIDLYSLNIAYECFSIIRFGFRQEDLPALMNLIKNCRELHMFDPSKLITEEVLTGNTLDDFDGYSEFEGDDDTGLDNL